MSTTELTAISDQDLELLSQWIDGELNEVDSRRLQQRLEKEPALRSTCDRMQALDASLRLALRERSPVPPAIAAQLAAPAAVSAESAESNVLAFPGRRETATADDGRRWPLALAASLVAAVGIVLVTQPVGDQGTGLPGNDALVSSGLDHLTSASGWTDLGDGRQLQPVLSFAHRDGTWCREYLLRSDDSDWRAVACREEGRWETKAAGLESYLDSTNAYRPAGAADSAPVSVFISEYAAGIALGRDEEQALIGTEWQ